MWGNRPPQQESFAPPFETELDWFLNLNVKAPYFLTQHLFGVPTATKGVVINILPYVLHRMLPGTDPGRAAVNPEQGLWPEEISLTGRFWNGL
jgi:hypothetical protein